MINCRRSCDTRLLHCYGSVYSFADQLILTSSTLCGSWSDYFGCWSETKVALASTSSEDVGIVL